MTENIQKTQTKNQQDPILQPNQPAPLTRQNQEPISQYSQQLEEINHNDHLQNAIIPEEKDESQRNEADSKIRQEFRLDQQNSLEISSRIQNAMKNGNSNNLNNEKVPSCNCKKSKCLKMYCDCYAKNLKCRDTCKCVGCQNTKNFIKQKKPDGRNDQEIQKSQDSNKKSVKPKQRSCNCKKSFCLKKYCECFNVSQPCGESCKCEDCKNTGQNNGPRNQKPNGTMINEVPIINTVMTKHVPEAISQINRINNKKQEPCVVRRKQKPDEDQIQTKISQILKLVPQQNYQTMLDFLAYCLS